MLRVLLVEGFGVCVILLIGNAFRWWSELAPSRAPAREKLLRSPGESLRRNLEQLNQYLIYSVAVFLLVPMCFAWQTPNLLSLWPLLFLAIIIVLCALPGLCVIRLYRAYALGLRGQRAVGEELNQLMLDGCHVFHDVPAGTDRNIDHIVVGPSGVYAIETKTRRKRRVPDGEKEHEVVFDGKGLHFPDANEQAPIELARSNAVALGRELNRSLSEPVTVKAILTLPGWWVVRRGKADVQVLNPKEIWQAIVTPATPELSPAQVQRIAYHLGQKCRDVEL